MMIIRIFDENRDVDGFLELFRIAFGKPMSREHFEWKYIKNPFRTNIYPIIVVEEEGRLIGTRCRVVSRMMVNGNRVLATMGADGMVNPEFRNRKIYAEMTRVVDELVRELGVVIHYSYPNNMSFNSAIRYGSKPIRMLTKYWKALNPQEVFSTVFHNPILRVAGSLLSPLLWYKTRVQKLRNRSVTVKDVNDVKILENVYHRWRQTDKIHTIRDEKYLTWKFKSHPEIVYQFLAAYVGQEVRGYFVINVTEFMGMKRGTIVDYLVVNDDPDIFEPLLNYALHVFKANSCALIDTWVFTQRWAQQAIEDYGFLSSRNILLRRWLPKTYLVARPVDERNFPHNLASFDWYITPSDSDAY